MSHIVNKLKSKDEKGLGLTIFPFSALKIASISLEKPETERISA